MDFNTSFSQGLAPKAAFIIYNCLDNNSQEQQIVARHKFDLTKNGYVLGTAKLLSESQQIQVAEHIVATKKTSLGLLPENVIHIGINDLIWYVKAKVWKMAFPTEKGTEYFDVPLPAHLIRAKDGEFFAYALKSNKRPTANTEIFHSPVPNVYSDGRICQGSVKFPKHIDLNAMSDIEASIFRTVSTGIHNRGIKGISRSDHTKYLQGLANEKKQRFSVTKLIKHNGNVNDLL